MFFDAGGGEGCEGEDLPAYHQVPASVGGCQVVPSFLKGTVSLKNFFLTNFMNEDFESCRFL